MELRDRFLKKVIKSKNCWQWNAAKSAKGYGYIGVRGKDGWKTKYAHRISYELFRGKIPRGLLVLHKCDNPGCVNPKHLFIGTDMDNCRDKINKGRLFIPHGESNGNSKLTLKQVKKIRLLYSTGRYFHKDLAKQFGVKKSSIGHIVNNQSWNELTTTTTEE